MTKKLVLALGALAVAGAGIHLALEPFRIELPEGKRPGKSISLPQNWDAILASGAVFVWRLASAANPCVLSVQSCRHLLGC